MSKQYKSTCKCINTTQKNHTKSRIHRGINIPHKPKKVRKIKYNSRKQSKIEGKVVLLSLYHYPTQAVKGNPNNAKSCWSHAIKKANWHQHMPLPSNCCQFPWPLIPPTFAPHPYPYPFYSLTINISSKLSISNTHTVIKKFTASHKWNQFYLFSIVRNH